MLATDCMFQAAERIICGYQRRLQPSCHIDRTMGSAPDDTAGASPPCAVSDGYFQVEEGIDRATLLRLYSQVMDGARKVFAPFGLPSRLLLYCPRVLLHPVHTALFESVLDAVSEQVYLKEGLTETAVAVAMHHFVDTEGDRQIREAVQAMQGALNLIWEPATVVPLPDEAEQLPRSKEEVLALVGRVKAAFETAPAEAPGPGGKKERAVKLWKALEGLDTQPWEVQEALSGVWSLDKEVQRQVEGVTGLALARDDLLHAIVQLLDEEEEEGEEKPPPAAEGEKEGAKAGPPLMSEALAHFVEFCDAVEEAEELMGRGRLEDALESYDDALQMEEEGLLVRVPGSALARVLHQRATCHVAAGDPEAALEDLDAAIDKDGACAAAFQLRGQVRLELGWSTEQVVSDYCRAYALEGLKLPSELQELEKALKDESRDEALQLLQDKRAKQRESPPQLPARWLMESYFGSFAAERQDGGLRKEAPCEGPEDTPADRHLRDALELRVAGRYEEAWASLQSAASEEGGGHWCDAMEALCQNQLGSFLYLVGDLEAAEQALTASLHKAEPGSATRINSLIKLGEVLSDMGRLEEGVARLDEAVAEAAGPTDCDPLLHRGQIHLTHDDVVAAVNDLRRAVATSGAVPPVAWACLGTALFKLEEGSTGGQAERVLQEALEQHPHCFEVLLYYGDILAEKGNIVSSVAQFSEAHSLDPASPLPFVHAARAYMTVRDLTLAEKHLRRALELDPTCSASYLDLGQLEVQRGHSRQALECFEAGMAQARYLPEVQDALVFRKLANLQLQQQQQEAASKGLGGGSAGGDGDMPHLSDEA